ncbi:endonuclease/exonuclease/phosphatase family protein [Janibacter sp. DB-40]|uniref:endonuclease/exonuclease/phosphatase family protein n=1 Tax=Janibacter sp. DB-40 TaxID=3028808 RepID=UPI0024052539|nr:endonuclease/exonuclease/phosphatase family protein [Janibacter sp. DB-40]
MVPIVFVRVATWNINYPGPAVSQSLGQMARERGVDLLLLQEANPNSLDQLVTAAGLDWVITAFTEGATYPSATGRRRVTAIAGRGQAPTTESGVLAELTLQERMVFAHLTTDAGPLSVASYHAPPGVSWGITKVHHAHALLKWIDETDGSVIVGADANTRPLIIRIPSWSARTGRPAPGNSQGLRATTSLSAGDHSTVSVTPFDCGWTTTRMNRNAWHGRTRRVPSHSHIAPVADETATGRRAATTHYG